MNISTEKKIMDLENRLVVAEGEGEGVVGTGNLGFITQGLAFNTSHRLTVSGYFILFYFIF